MPVELSAPVTITSNPDTVGSTLDTLVNFGSSIGATEGTVIALVIAALVFARAIWKFYKARKG